MDTQSVSLLAWECPALGSETHSPLGPRDPARTRAPGKVHNSLMTECTGCQFSVFRCLEVSPNFPGIVILTWAFPSSLSRAGMGRENV